MSSEERVSEYFEQCKVTMGDYGYPDCIRLCFLSKYKKRMVSCRAKIDLKKKKVEEIVFRQKYG